MSEIEDKILGREGKKKKLSVRKDVFSTDTVWKVSRKGCGTSLVNGCMVYEMLSTTAKQKAMRGLKRICDKDFEFLRLS